VLGGVDALFYLMKRTNRRYQDIVTGRRKDKGKRNSLEVRACAYVCVYVCVCAYVCVCVREGWASEVEPLNPEAFLTLLMARSPLSGPSARLPQPPSSQPLHPTHPTRA
jgi:hypothetical protein